MKYRADKKDFRTRY